MPLALAIACVVGSWRSWGAMDPNFRAGARGALVHLLLLLLTLVTLALLVHVGAGYFIWRRFPASALPPIAGGLALASLLPVTTLLLGRGWLRVLPPLGGLAAAFVWSVMVAGLVLAHTLHR